MSRLQHAYATRDRMLQRLDEDLLGGELDWKLTEAPLSRFAVGILYPTTEDARGPVAEAVENHVEGDIDSEMGSGAPDAPVDPSVSLSKVKNPRSIGLTFALAGAEGLGTSVSVSVTAASYENTGGDTWRRVPLPAWTTSVDCSRPGVRRYEVSKGLELVATVREARAGAVAVTLSIVNNAVAPRGDRDAYCWFAPRIVVRPIDAEFCQRPAVVAGTDEDEVASQRLLFREVQSFAVGHGCATAWDLRGDGRVLELSTTFLPAHELLLSDTGGAEDVDLRMDHLGTTDDYRGLDRLVELYEDWIQKLRGSPGLGADERSTLNRHVADAREAAGRMRDGISLLRSDAAVRTAFQLTNLAMAQQRSRQEHHRAGKIGDPPATAEASWRPFQIAFILTNLRGLADGDHPDRRIADVLWFPTGGGKTEAYLGIIGIVILLRRLHDAKAAGVSVLMRYTLRLLTLQQYQRATGLICALEYLRQMRLPSTAAISIGLWVGQGSTPNSVEEARRALNKARRGRSASDSDDDAGDPVQLRQCPWCGVALDHNNYEIVDRTWMKVACGTPTCAFRNGLPVHILDDDVYSARPSLVIATVDKFAMLPWKREAGSLLGAETTPSSEGETFMPPDLIVQDELHLISGPLGTIVGLYETAIDAICSRVHPPKIVASTATIRRAGDQIRAVFAREARQFPPPGLTYRDSYFAAEAPRDSKGSRAYAGVMAPGASHATLMVRVYASLLQSASTVADDDEDADLYWTLLGYFNSLRVLGGAYIQVLDDVPDQMKVIARRRGEDVRARPQLREMTSRKKSWEIPMELKILEQGRGEPEAADVVLATNMISVGVDVDRLGLMVVMGQPQTSSEYIQATSRVGRRMPGLVVTIYNAARSRDLSHYENFPAYHRTLYRHVEATAATPFAPRARDRALHAVLVSLARHTIPKAAPSRAAGDAAMWQPELDECVRVVLERLSVTRSREEFEPGDESPDYVKGQLEALVDEWTGAHLDHYEGWFGKRKGALIVEASRALSQGESSPVASFPPIDPPWPTLTSMRDVDAESSVYLVRARRRSSR